MPASDERKPVTVLFADLAGSAELATRHDPEPLRALLSAFFDKMRQQIEAFGGTVEKYAGDAIMAVFGVPRVNEDDAERAARAAAHRALGQAHEARGGREEAEGAYRKSLEILEDGKPRPELGQTLLAYGRFKHADDAAEGRRLIERARAILAEIGAAGWLAETTRALEGR